MALVTSAKFMAMPVVDFLEATRPSSPGHEVAKPSKLTKDEDLELRCALDTYEVFDGGLCA